MAKAPPDHGHESVVRCNRRDPLTGEQSAARVTGWPCRTGLELGALPGAVPCARLHAKLVLWEWGVQELAESVELVISELMTNALRASNELGGARGRALVSEGVPPVRFWLACDGRKVLIQVWDASYEPPVREDVEPEAEAGRGLLLVEELSAQWGSYVPDLSGGKVVWALVTAT